MADMDDDSAMTADVKTWLDEIERAQRDMSTWDERCKKIRRLYRYDNSTRAKTRRFHIFWSNIQTIAPAIYALTPKPVVVSRFNDGDPVARQTAMLVERCLKFMGDTLNYQRTFLQVRDDYLLYGRGVPRLRYEPVFVEGGDAQPLDDAQMGGPEAAAEQATDDAAPEEVLEFENVYVDYVQREDFIHPKSRTWEEVPWVAYRAYLTRDELVDRFPDVGKSIPLDSRVHDQSDEQKTSPADKATVYEIWDKTERKVLWIAKGHPEVLEEGEPYLKLTGFYPSPRPAYGTLTGDSLEPIPDYIFYQDQVEEINQLTARIASLTDSLKLVGFYPAGPNGEGAPEIERAVLPGVENKMIGVKAWAAFKEGGGGGAPIVWLPVEQVASIIKECIGLRRELISDIYQITGISDIMRGETNPNETAEAQNLKTQFGSTRMEDRRREVARMCRDVMRMAGEIVAEHFQVETLEKIANVKLPREADIQLQQVQAAIAYQQQAKQAQLIGQQMPPMPQPKASGQPTFEMVEQMLRDGILRRFRLDIETDSTISTNAAQEKQDRTQFLGAVSQFISAWGPMVQQNPMLAPLAGQLILFGVRAFPVARELEETVEKFIQMMEEHASQPQQQPNPEMEKAKADIQISQVKAKNDMQIATTKAANDMQIEREKMALEQQSHHHDMQIKVAQHQMDTQLQQQSAHTAMQTAQMKALQRPAAGGGQ